MIICRPDAHDQLNLEANEVNKEFDQSFDKNMSLMCFEWILRQTVIQKQILLH